MLAYVEHEIVINQLETMFLDNFLLTTLNFRIVEFDHLARINAHHVVMVAAISQLEHGVTAIEVMPLDQACSLKLRQHAIHGGQAHIFTRFHQRLVDIFRAHVPRLGIVEHLQNLDPRQGNLEPSFAKFVIFYHGLLSQWCRFAASFNTGMIGIQVAQDSGSHPPMQKTKLLLTSLSLTGLLALAGCSFPGVYKIDIQQGNVVTQDMIDQLRPGMTRRQVRFIMGNPLITDTFHRDRWDYLYSIQPGGGQRYQEHVSLVFDGNDQLIGLAGDFLPGVSRDQSILGEGSDTVTPTQATEPAATPGSLLEQIQREVDDVKSVPVPIPEPLDIDPQ